MTPDRKGRIAARSQPTSPALPSLFIHQLGRSRRTIDAQAFSTITTDCHRKRLSVHQSCALPVRTMIRVLAYTLTMVLYHRQVRVAAGPLPLVFARWRDRLATAFSLSASIPVACVPLSRGLPLCNLFGWVHSRGTPGRPFPSAANMPQNRPVVHERLPRCICKTRLNRPPPSNFPVFIRFSGLRNPFCKTAADTGRSGVSPVSPVLPHETLVVLSFSEYRTRLRSCRRKGATLQGVEKRCGAGLPTLVAGAPAGRVGGLPRDSETACPRQIPATCLF